MSSLKLQTTDVVLVRHGQTPWSLSGQHTGRTDVPLTPEGAAQADALADRLAGRRFGVVLSSPMERAVETAHRAGLVPTIDDDLLEWDYGAWEGRTTADIRAELGDPDWVVWDHPVPSGRTPGEQAIDVARRASRVIGRCAPFLSSGQDCALIAHGHVLRILTATWLGLPAGSGRLFALAPATISALGFEREQRVISAWNT